MRRLTFMVDLCWRIRFERNLDKAFNDPEYMIDFNHFLPTEEGQRWLKSEQGQLFLKWQES